MRILVFSTLYPNAAEPTHGIFVENRIRHWRQSSQFDVRVIAPVPWFPSTNPTFGRYAKFAEAPRAEKRHGIEISHPRFLAVPKVGMTIAPLLLALGALRTMREVLDREGPFDLIDAHYVYPDGIAAAILSRWFNLPLVVTARGTDINLIPRYSVPRKWIRWASSRASRIVAVCSALAEEIAGLGVPQAKLRVLRNGVDLEVFHPVDRRAAKARFGVRGPTVASVGGLIPRKGHDLVIEAVSKLPDVNLLIAGEGPERRRLSDLAERLGMTDRVRFTGRVPHEELKYLYSACDALVLASDREGWPNVLLEAMACGTPVVATRVWGTPEVVRSRTAGILVDERTPGAIERGVASILAEPWDRDATRTYAESFSWDETTRGQIELFESVVKG